MCTAIRIALVAAVIMLGLPASSQAASSISINYEYGADGIYTVTSSMRDDCSTKRRSRSHRIVFERKFDGQSWAVFQPTATYKPLPSIKKGHVVTSWRTAEVASTALNKVVDGAYVPAELRVTAIGQVVCRGKTIKLRRSRDLNGAEVQMMPGSIIDPPA